MSYKVLLVGGAPCDRDVIDIVESPSAFKIVVNLARTENNALDILRCNEALW